MKIHNFIKSSLAVSRALVVAMMLLGISLQAAAESVGIVISTKGTVTVHPLSSEPSFIGKDSLIFPGDTITTADKSFAVLEFVDGAKVVVRQNSVFAVEGYSYDQGEDDSSLKLLKGGIRALTGAIARENPDNYELETPFAALGVRGTRYDAILCGNDCAEREKELAQTKRSFAPADSECKVRLRLDGLPPGAYFLVHEDWIVLTKGDEKLEVGPGDVAFADENRLGCLPATPAFIKDDDAPFPWQDDLRPYTPLQCGA